MAGLGSRSSGSGVAGFLDSSPRRLRHWSVLALGAWNALMWLARIRNIVRDDTLDAGSRALWLVPAIVFGVGGLVALMGWWRGGRVLLWLVAGLSLATLLYWPVRLVFIMVDGRSLGFRLVHLVLAVVSVGLASAVGRRLLRTNLIPTGAYR